MRIELQFMLKNCKLPFDYRRVFLAFFKKALTEIADGRFYEEYYSSPAIRKFTFAVNLPKPVFDKGEITLGKNQVRLTFSAADTNTGYVFMSAFIKQKGKSMPAPLKNCLTLDCVRRLPEKNVSSGSVLIKMLSPLCIREHTKQENADKYYSVAGDDFKQAAKRIITAQLVNAGFTEKMAEEFSITPVDAKKTVVYHYNSYIECNLGMFILEADSTIINYLLKNGIGSRKSAGFGLAELIAEGGEVI